ncbi:tripartite tricarboxylate transporter permease [uncultured Dysosmobacter sp.]|uniref:tripartite tricarboxylate transporter permease n=1 Tax=uncultured Dysosmobacter sp. TaxID=2591384 RepID=UPI00262D737B|nr:tripartite tricarboxylate transporter permease [uncultured Dysosmobacter sp.]
MEHLDYMLRALLDPQLLLFLGVGVFLGIYIGAVPGLSVTMAASLLISFTYSWDVLPAMAAMIGIYIGGVYGGSRSAILLNIPGAPAAVATALDGYPLAQKGLAGQAIGITVVQSVLGGFIGTVILALGAPQVAKVAMAFAPRDYFLLAVMGLLLVGSLGSESPARGVMSAALGVFVGFIGLDSQTGHLRFVAGPSGSSFHTYMMLGVNYVVVMIGLFGMSEALIQLRDPTVQPVKQKVDKIVPGWKNILKYLPLSIRTSLLGTFVGALPGTGGDIAALMAYDHAKWSTKNPETPFGQGAIEGLVACESANNAAIGGACIPMLTLGIPGDAVTAIMIGAMYIHGLNPGPLMMKESSDVFWYIIGAMFVGNVFLLILGFTGIKLFAKIVEIPKYILMPIIIILSVVGAFSINNSLMDVYWMIAFGILGYLMKLYHFPVAPAILGIILVDLIELNFRRAVMTVGGSFTALLGDILTHPMSLLLLAVIVGMLLSSAGIFKKLRCGAKKR